MVTYIIHDVGSDIRKAGSYGFLHVYLIVYNRNFSFFGADPCQTDNGGCRDNAECIVDGGQKFCDCSPGYVEEDESCVRKC